MDQSNMIAQEIKTHGVRTFSAKEMAFNILGLMHPILKSITQVEPVWGDLSGGFGCIADLAHLASRIRVNMNKKAELRRTIARDNATEFKVIIISGFGKLGHGDLCVHGGRWSRRVI
jgi:fatty acid synthase subunit alpha